VLATLLCSTAVTAQSDDERLMSARKLDALRTATKAFPEGVKTLGAPQKLSIDLSGGADLDEALSDTAPLGSFLRDESPMAAPAEIVETLADFEPLNARIDRLSWLSLGRARENAEERAVEAGG
jgi:hypothetical protein